MNDNTPSFKFYAIDFDPITLLVCACTKEINVTGFKFLSYSIRYQLNISFILCVWFVFEWLVYLVGGDGIVPHC